MRIVTIDGDTACCEAGGIERDVDLYLLGEDPPVPDDYVLVHVGYAIQKIDEASARKTLLLLDSVDSA